MYFVSDTHNDSLMYARLGAPMLEDQTRDVTIEKMRAGGVGMLSFAVFIPPKDREPDSQSYLFEGIARYREMLEKQPSLKPIKCARDARELAPGEMGALLSVEGGGEGIGDKVWMLPLLYTLGVRLFSLTWNYGNPLACGCLDEQDTGLTAAGREAIRILENLQVPVDISHLSDKSTFGVLEYAQRPIIASHSNMRSLFEHPRNLTDDMLRLMAQRGDYVGINFFSNFLRSDHQATLEDIADHIEYACEKLGAEQVGLGSDFDGISLAPVGLEDTSKFQNIAPVLFKRGFTEEQIKGIMGENLLRFLEKNHVGEKV